MLPTISSLIQKLNFCQSSCSDYQIIVLPLAPVQTFTAVKGGGTAPAEGTRLCSEENQASVAG